MWLLPSHNRVGKLQRLLDSLGSQDLEQQICVLVWGGDPAIEQYLKLELPGSVRMFRLNGEYSYCTEKLNWAWEHFPFAPFYGFIADDLVALKKDQLKACGELAGAWNLVSVRDTAGAWPGHPAIGGKLARAMGFLALPELKHNCIDSVWNDIMLAFPELARESAEVVWKLEHPVYGSTESKCEWDEAYLRVREINEKAAFQYELAWIRSGMRERTFERIKTALKGG